MLIKPVMCRVTAVILQPLCVLHGVMSEGQTLAKVCSAQKLYTSLVDTIENASLVHSSGETQTQQQQQQQQLRHHDDEIVAADR